MIDGTVCPRCPVCLDKVFVRHKSIRTAGTLEPPMMTQGALCISGVWHTAVSSLFPTFTATERWFVLQYAQINQVKMKIIKARDI